MAIVAQRPRLGRRPLPRGDAAAAATGGGARTLSPQQLCAAFACSRLLVLAAGCAGALFAGRLTGWRRLDPTGVSASLGSVGNVLASASVRWDAINYLSIAAHGYANSLHTAFFPLYPLLIRALGYVTGSDVVAGILISLAAFAGALVLLHRLTAELLGRSAADATVLLLAFAPLSFFFTAIYTESLLLLLGVATFYLASRDRFTLACLTAAGAALTHVDGIVLLAPLAYMRWERASLVRAALPLALPVIALCGWLFYLHSRGYGWLAPVTNQHSWSRELVGPPETLWLALSAGASGLWQTLHGVSPFSQTHGGAFGHPFQNVVYLAILVISLCALASAWRRLPRAYAIYAAALLIVCTCDPLRGVPLSAFDRFMLPAFPLWMAAAAWLNERRLLPTVLRISAVALFFYTVAFARWVFVA